MAELHRVRCVWTGFLGAPGFTTLYFDATSSPPNTAAVRSWFQGLQSLFPNVVSIQVPGTGDIVTTDTGVISGTWTTATPAVVTGAVAGVYAAPSGAIANFLTGAVVGTRRLRGRAFLVPTAGTAYDTNGTLTSTALSTLTTAHNTFLAAVTPTFHVWHRPVGGTGGSSAPVSSIVSPDKACVLRSRRD